MTTTEDITIDAAALSTPHDPTNAGKLASLVESMSEQGWTGRPILVLDVYGARRALTGSHRIAAAVEAGIDVPCLLLRCDDDLTRKLDRAAPDDLASIIVGALGDDHPAADLISQEGD